MLSLYSSHCPLVARRTDRDSGQKTSDENILAGLEFLSQLHQVEVSQHLFITNVHSAITIYTSCWNSHIMTENIKNELVFYV
jgi:hypothetical protein